MKYVRLDVHAEATVFRVVDAAGNEVAHGRIATRGRAVAATTRNALLPR